MLPTVTSGRPSVMISSFPEAIWENPQGPVTPQPLLALESYGLRRRDGFNLFRVTPVEFEIRETVRGPLTRRHDRASTPRAVAAPATNA